MRVRIGLVGFLALLLLVRGPVVVAERASADHGPKIVMIIRHGEKPEADKTNADLSAKGRERAQALARHFAERFPRPDFLIATARSKHSNRPYETIEPLSKALHEPIADNRSDDEFAAVARDVLHDPRYAGKVVLIAWHHGKIPELAHALGATDAPAKWKSEVFDRVWEIEYHDGAATFRDLPQQMLPGDAKE